MTHPGRDSGRRVCRTCGESYEYPGHKSLATRTACPRCIGIPEETRRVLGILRRRVDRLARQVERQGGGGQAGAREGPA